MNSFPKNLIEYPEGRRREYKETLPAAEELAKTVIAFSNDAGGELFIGVKDQPRQVVGAPVEQPVPDLEHGSSGFVHKKVNSCDLIGVQFRISRNCTPSNCQQLA